METKGITHGDISTAFKDDLNINIEKIVNAKAGRKRPYYILIHIKGSYDGPLAMGSNNELLHGEDKKQERSRGETKEMDLSEMKVGHTVIQVLEPWQVPNVPLISNILMKVDNKTGSIERMYALPPDIPTEDDGNSIESESVIRDSKGMPIVYGETG